MVSFLASSLASSLADAKPIVNDPVAGLIDFPLPHEVGLWPQTWVLRIAVAVVFVAAAVSIWQLIRHYRANRYRREALAELKRLNGARPPGELLAQLAMLVRRTALAAFPREQVASLDGTAWLTFLDRTSDSSQFSSGTGRLLAGAPYQAKSPGPGELHTLMTLVRRWIRGHHV